MKKYFVILLLMLITSPVYAVCAVEAGMCKAGVRGFESLNERLLPDNLEQLKKPVTLQTIDAPNDLRYNMDEPQPNSGAVMNNPYNSNCQFGNCLGGAAGGGD